MTAQYIEDGLSLVYWFVKFSFCFQYLDLLYAPAENDRAGSGTAVTGAVFVSVLAAAETAAGNYDVAAFWVIVIILISFVIVTLINIVSGRGMNSRRWI